MNAVNIATPSSVPNTLTTPSDYIAQTYDDVPYDSHAFAQTHPNHLRTVGALFGIDAPPLGTARVLELGCASGGNLLPMAFRNPQAQFVGIDLSSKQIEVGQRDAVAMGVKNLSLQTRSITDINEADGQFDYIICHGVYSWVPPEVQAAILQVCKTRLSPQGIAYISYNTYPGWKGKEIVRDAMRYRATKGDTPEAALSMAKGMVDFLATNAANGSPLKQHMQEQQTLMGTVGDYYLQHEFLEIYNEPCYFETFVNRAREQGLAYLSEAEVNTIYLSNLGGELAQQLLNECGNDQVAIEQYMDYLRNRAFRQTLLVHDSRKPSIRYNTPLNTWMALHYEGRYALKPDTAHDFSTRSGAGAHLPLPWHKAVASALTAASPATLNAATLLSVAQACDTQVSMNDLCQMLSQQHQGNALRISCVAIDAAAAPSAKPQTDAFNVAHAQAFKNTYKQAQFVNCWHEHTKFFDPYAVVLAQCDGIKADSDLDNPRKIELQLAYQYGLMVA